MTIPAVETAVQYIIRRGYSIPTETLGLLRSLMTQLTPAHKSQLVQAYKAGTLDTRWGAIKAGPEYDAVRNDFWIATYDAVYEYLFTGATSIVSFRNRMQAAIKSAWTDAADIGYVDGGGDLPLDDDTQSWIDSEIASQLAYCDNLFQNLKDLRKEGGYDANGEGFDRADSWASSLDGLYNAAKLRGAGNKMLTWVLGNTEMHCATCGDELAGERHRASWYISRNYIPKRAGAAMECGGYRCDCSLVDDSGNEYTL